MINIKEGKQAGPTNPNYENLKLQIKSVIKKKKKEILMQNWQGCGKSARER